MPLVLKSYPSASVLRSHSSQGTWFGMEKMSHPIRGTEELLVLLCMQSEPEGLHLCWYTEELTSERGSKNPESKACFIKGVHLLSWHSGHWLPGLKCYLLADVHEALRVFFCETGNLHENMLCKYQVTQFDWCNPWCRTLSSLTPPCLKSKQK